MPTHRVEDTHGLLPRAAQHGDAGFKRHGFRQGEQAQQDGQHHSNAPGVASGQPCSSSRKLVQDVPLSEACKKLIVE